MRLLMGSRIRVGWWVVCTEENTAVVRCWHTAAALGPGASWLRRAGIGAIKGDVEDRRSG